MSWPIHFSCLFLLINFRTRSKTAIHQRLSSSWKLWNITREAGQGRQHLGHRSRVFFSADLWFAKSTGCKRRWSGRNQLLSAAKAAAVARLAGQVGQHLRVLFFSADLSIAEPAGCKRRRTENRGCRKQADERWNWEI